MQAGQQQQVSSHNEYEILRNLRLYYCETGQVVLTVKDLKFKILIKPLKSCLCNGKTGLTF